MPVKKHFRYKKGKTEIEGDSDNKDAVRLAYLNTIMYWVVQILLILSTGSTLYTIGKLLGH